MVDWWEWGLLQEQFFCLPPPPPGSSNTEIQNPTAITIKQQKQNTHFSLSNLQERINNLKRYRKSNSWNKNREIITIQLRPTNFAQHTRKSKSRQIQNMGIADYGELLIKPTIISQIQNNLDGNPKIHWSNAEEKLPRTPNKQRIMLFDGPRRINQAAEHRKKSTKICRDD